MTFDDWFITGMHLIQHYMCQSVCLGIFHDIHNSFFLSRTKTKGSGWPKAPNKTCSHLCASNWWKLQCALLLVKLVLNSGFITTTYTNAHGHFSFVFFSHILHDIWEFPSSFYGRIKKQPRKIRYSYRIFVRTSSLKEEQEKKETRQQHTTRRTTTGKNYKIK